MSLNREEFSFDAKRFNDWASPLRNDVETHAKKVLTPTSKETEKLVGAMSYAVTGGGKRIRALLSYAAGELTGAKKEDTDLVALALEFVHAYSLIHDDLPSMDNDTLRRGKPTCHVMFGEGEAMLAGDALQPEAFLLLTRLSIPEASRLEAIAIFAKACGREGMCAGQAIDLENVGHHIDLELLTSMHRKKTGALIKAAILMGALCGSREMYEKGKPALLNFSAALGLGFQVVDDILDVTSDAATLGKTAGKDAENDKPTFVSLMGLEASKALAQKCLNDAIAALKKLEEEKIFSSCSLTHLAYLAHYMIERTK